MLLEFKATNYKTFLDEMTFSMVPAPKQKGLEHSVFSETIGKKRYRGLCSSVLYGPNASGKTNLVGAMDTFKDIVLRGHIRNEEDINNPNIAAGILELIPNRFASKGAPVAFSIKFIEDGLLVEYAFAADLGDFLHTGYSRTIVFEELKINNSMLFSRSSAGGLEFDSLDKVEDYMVNAFRDNERSAIALAKSNLHQEELFLMNGFKTMFSSKLAAMIADWLEDKFTVIYRADAVHISPLIPESEKGFIIVDEPLNAAARQFGIDSNELAFFGEDDNQARLFSILHGPGKKARRVPAEWYESFGTFRFTNMFPFLKGALRLGGTLVVDEFDASIHPMALMNIINIFHNDEINVNRAQLIFNTHNPIFLNPGLFRRDEIKFVERDDKTHSSTLYSLSDFGAAGKNGVRKNEDYMKNYFIDRYGAIRNVDFTAVFEKIMESGKEV